MFIGGKCLSVLCRRFSLESLKGDGENALLKILEHSSKKHLYVASRYADVCSSDPFRE